MSKINNKTKRNIVINTLILSAILALAVLFLMPAKASACQTYGAWHYYFGDTNEPCDGYNNSNYNYNNGYYNNGYYNNQNIPTPVIYSITPNATASGNTGLTVTIYGNNFTASSVARWNSSSRMTTYINSATLLMQLNSNDFSVSGDYLITVYNGNLYQSNGLSNAAYFNVSHNVIANGSITKTPPVYTASVKKTTTTKAVAKTTTPNTFGSLAANAIFGTNSFMPSSLIQWLLLFILILLFVILIRKLLVREENKHTPLKHA